MSCDMRDGGLCRNPGVVRLYADHTRFRAEVERLRALWEKAESDLLLSRDEVERLRARAHATDGTCGECAHPLYVENERLREALGEIADYADDQARGVVEVSAVCLDHCAHLARAALESKK